jgi:hypothetical protein
MYPVLVMYTYIDQSSRAGLQVTLKDYPVMFLNKVNVSEDNHSFKQKPLPIII